MRELRYTLLSDGPSDKALIPILTWLLREHYVKCPIQDAWADLGRLRRPPKTLSDRMKWGLDLYPCDLLFVHRDAEAEPLEKRVNEIHNALKILKDDAQAGREVTICVVPVRMMEAWLLFDERALRLAAGNPSGKEAVDIPPLKSIEEEPNPKRILHNLLRQASGLSGRRLKRFRVSTAVQRITDFIPDFSPLRNLSAFRVLEQEIARVIGEQKWSGEG
jgi:hypothetical protein